MSVPHWLRQDDRVLAEHEWAVIGGGVTGLCAAIALADAGEDAIVIERETVGRRASTRNAGYLMRGAAENYAIACDHYGRERAKELWTLTEENLLALREMGACELPSYRETPSCLLAFDEGEFDELSRSFEMLTDDGFDARWITAGTDAAWANATPPRAGLINPHDAVCNPADLLAMLRARCTARVREHTPIGDIHHKNSFVELVVPGGVIRARRVIVCTNAYAADLLPSLGSTVEPNRGQMLALRVPGPMLDFAYYSDRGSEYYRDRKSVV